jgi:hypothetical protein
MKFEDVGDWERELEIYDRLFTLLSMPKNTSLLTPKNASERSLNSS